MDIQKTRYEKLVTHVEPHASTVSLLKRAENSAISAIINQKPTDFERFLIQLHAKTVQVLKKYHMLSLRSVAFKHLQSLITLSMSVLPVGEDSPSETPAVNTTEVEINGPLVQQCPLLSLE